MQWRDLVKWMGPSWLTKDSFVIQKAQGPVEGDSRLLRTLMSMFDVQRRRLQFGVQARLTQVCPYDALQFVGRNLDTWQGPNESVAAYRARLQTAIDDKRAAGTAWPLLRQIRGYCAPYAVRVRLVNDHGHWYTIDRNGTQSTYRYSAWNWDNAKALAIQTNTTRQTAFGNIQLAIPWARFWIIIYPTTTTPTQPWQTDGTWGDGQKWGDNGQTWGSTATAGDVQAIRRIVQRWKPLASTCVSIVVCFNDTDFNPSTTAPPLPNGTWKWAGTYSGSRPGVLVSGRGAGHLFWDGSAPGAPL